jgi:D-alanyl-D-alanine carboxypeptidase
MSTSLDSLVPELQPFAKALIDLAGVNGLQPRVTSTRRNHFEQVRLYTRFLAGRALYPTAVPGTSAHEYGEAFDVVVTPYEALEDLGSLWASWGGSWGGASDPVHFELPGASQAHRISPQTHTLAEAADLVLGFLPGLSEVELAATLLHLGFPQSQVLDFLSGPLGYLTR